MRKLLLCASLALVIFLPWAHSASAQDSLSPAHATAINDSVRQTLAAYQAAMAQGQWGAAGSYYANSPDFRWVEEGQVVARSAMDIRQYLSVMKPTMRITTTFQALEVFALAPGLASVVTGFSTTMADSGSAGVSFSGQLTMTLVHAPKAG